MLSEQSWVACHHAMCINVTHNRNQRHGRRSSLRLTCVDVVSVKAFNFYSPRLYIISIVCFYFGFIELLNSHMKLIGQCHVRARRWWRHDNGSSRCPRQRSQQRREKWCQRPGCGADLGTRLGPISGDLRRGARRWRNIHRRDIQRPLADCGSRGEQKYFGDYRLSSTLWAWRSLFENVPWSFLGWNGVLWQAEGCSDFIWKETVIVVVLGNGLRICFFSPKMKKFVQFGFDSQKGLFAAELLVFRSTCVKVTGSCFNEWIHRW